MQIHAKIQYLGVLIITKAAKTMQTTLWSNNFALREAVMNHNWRYESATSTRNIAHYYLHTATLCATPKQIQYLGVLIITKAAKTKQTTLRSNNFALREAVMNHNWRYESATHIYTKHRTLLAPHSNVICIFKKNFIHWCTDHYKGCKKNRILCDRTILHSEEQLWTITEDTKAPHLHEISHTTSST